MLRICLPLLLSCCMPVLSAAADGPPPVCGAPGVAPDFTPSEGRALTREEARDLAALFRRLAGDWRGAMVENVCMQSGATRTRRHDAELKLTRSGDDLRLAGEYVQRPGNTIRPFTRTLFVTPGGLRVDQASRVGEVELLQAGPGGLVYVQRYRTVHRIGQEQPQPLPADDEDSDGEDADAARPVLRAAPVADSDAPVAGKPAKPKRRSLARAEQVTLRAVGSRGLVLVQDYYTQGVYAGSMRWELRRR